MLTKRQEQILRIVVEAYTASGTPIGSRSIAERSDVSWAASTVRNEFAVLVSHGLLEQPHTSAGRRPSEAGYRYFVNDLMQSGSLANRNPGYELSFDRRQVEEAIRETTETLAEATELMALVSAPPLSNDEIIRVELISLQSSKVMVVVISASGGVTKRVFEFDGEVDPGLVRWATGYLNETLTGVAMGARMIRSRLATGRLGATESEFIETIAPAFVEPPDGEDTLFVGGTGYLISSNREDAIPGLDRLLAALDQRGQMIRVMRARINERGVYLRIGHENESQELTGASVVGANYGTHTRPLGSVNVIGPVRMDYPAVIMSVRYAAARLSEFVTDVYA